MRTIRPAPRPSVRGAPLALALASGALLLALAPPAAAQGDTLCPDPPLDVAIVRYRASGEDGNETFLDLGTSWDTGMLEEGDRLRVRFQIAPGCEDVELSLASYEAPAATFELPQTLFDSDTGVFDAGVHTLEIDVPDCFFQVDFVRGPVIEDLDEELYGDRKIDWENGGTHSCTPPPCPEDLAATAQDDGSILLTWSASEGAARYNVYRGTGDGDLVFLDDTVATSYTDSSTAVGVTYHYMVTAEDDNGRESKRCTLVTTTAIPFFTGFVGTALATAGSVGAFLLLRRR